MTYNHKIINIVSDTFFQRISARKDLPNEILDACTGPRRFVPQHEPRGGSEAMGADAPIARGPNGNLRSFNHRLNHAFNKASSMVNVPGFIVSDQSILWTIFDPQYDNGRIIYTFLCRIFVYDTDHVEMGKIYLMLTISIALEGYIHFDNSTCCEISYSYAPNPTMHKSVSWSF
jgi:hypothetical protein